MFVKSMRAIPDPRTNNRTRTFPWSAGIGGLFVLLSALSPPNPLTAQATNDSARVAQTVKAFHDFLAAGDSASALKLLSPDVVIAESGGLENREHYRTGHLMADMLYAQEQSRQPGDIRVVVVGDVAWATSAATMVGIVDGREVSSSSAELMVLSRLGGEWTIRAVHWSSRRIR